MYGTIARRIGKHSIAVRTWLLAGLLGAGAAGFATPARAQGPPPISKGDFLKASGDLGLGWENRLQTSDNLMAWGTLDSIRIASVESRCPASMCAPCEPIRRQLPGIRLPGPRLAVPPPFALVLSAPGSGAGNVFEAVFAFAMPDGKLYRYAATLRADTSSAWALRRYSVPIGLKAGQWPITIAVQRDPDSLSDENIFISGVGGLLRRAGWRQGVLSVPGADLASQEVFTAYGGGLFGGLAGGIYSWNQDVPLSHQASGMPGPIRVLDGSGALGDYGFAAVKEGGGWTSFHLAEGGFRDFQVVRDSRGLGILRYPAIGAPVYSRLRDTPSGFGGIAVSSTAFSNAQKSIYYTGGSKSAPMIVKVPLSDSEGNFSAPLFDFIRGNPSQASDTVPLATGFVATDPAGGCAAPGLCVGASGGPLILTVRPDSVILDFPAQYTALVPLSPCKDLFRADTTLRIAKSWTYWDSFRIGEGNAEVTLVYEHEMGIRSLGRGAGFTAGPGGAVDAAGRKVGGAEGFGRKGNIHARFVRRL
ncbi:MAG: hypothetical protein JWO30_775 [Fibrobacteres bacterium]|nr:hypothetical protein [Fibrobacterota bacterium]